MIRVHDPRPKYRRIGWQMIGGAVVLAIVSAVTRIDAIGYPSFLLFVAGCVLRVVAQFSLRGVDDD